MNELGQVRCTVRLPTNLVSFESQVFAKLEEFSTKLSIDDVLHWILQFNSEDQTFAIKLFLALNYFSPIDVENACKILYARLGREGIVDLKNILFVSVGGPSDSSDMILYYYRIHNDLPPTCFVDLDGLRDRLSENPSFFRSCSLVFLDDFIGTGGEAISLLRGELRELLSQYKIHYTGFHALIGFADGIREIQTNLGIKVEVAHQLTEKDQAFNPASTLLTTDYYDLQRFKSTALEYGARLYPRGPLGYGNCQALVSFFYNTPNNTLPVIWAEHPWWKPLLRRTDSRTPYHPTEGEAIVMSYLAIAGEPCPHKEMVALAVKFGFDLKEALQFLTYRHITRVHDADFGQTVELSAKGKGVADELIGTDRSITLAVMQYSRERYLSIVPQTRGMSRAMFEALRRVRGRLVNVVRFACRLRDAVSMQQLHALSSWILLKEMMIDQRIEVGHLILTSFSESDLRSVLAYVEIDDLGWSYVTSGDLATGVEFIMSGLQRLSVTDDIYGRCQAWRHLQAVKERMGDLVGAAIGLRITYGAACAIEERAKRAHMRAGTLRALAVVAAKQGDFTAKEELLDRSSGISSSIGDEYHEQVEADQIKEREFDHGANDSGQVEMRIYLVRHPITMKNEKQTFGPHFLTQLPELACVQMKQAVESISREVKDTTTSVLRVYAGLAPVTSSFAVAIAKELGTSPINDSALDSIDCGDLAGYSEDEAARYYPEVSRRLSHYRAGELDGFDVEFPSGESVRAFTAKVADFLLQRVFTGRTPRAVVFVGHNSSITAILNILTAIDSISEEVTYRYFDVPLGRVIRISLSTSQRQPADLEQLT